jgi:hypothetical protein
MKGTKRLDAERVGGAQVLEVYDLRKRRLTGDAEKLGRFILTVEPPVYADDVFAVADLFQDSYRHNHQSDKAQVLPSSGLSRFFSQVVYQ